MVERLKSNVECHSGSRYGERPMALIFEGQRREIAAVQRQWRLPDGPCYRVITQSEERFDLIYLEHADTWRVFPLT